MRLTVVAVTMIAIGLVSASGCGVYDYEDPPSSKQALGLAKYEELTAAHLDGYVVDMSDRRTDYFVPGRGIAVYNPKYTALDGEKPQALLYEMGVIKCLQYECPNEGYKLVGYYYSQPASSGPPPSLFGQTFEGPVGDPPVYELTVWAKENPNGKYARENPTVQPPEWWPEHFRTWRELADKYPTPDAAAAGGYSFFFAERPDGELADCVYNRVPAAGQRGQGAMGYHWQRIDLLSRDPASIVPTLPAGLLYFQKDDLSWILGGLEYVLLAARQPTPTLYGIIFDGPMAGHQRTQPEHFDLHTYPGYLNPDGVFTTWNRAAECPLTK